MFGSARLATKTHSQIALRRKAFASASDKTFEKTRRQVSANVSLSPSCSRHALIEIFKVPQKTDGDSPTKSKTKAPMAKASVGSEKKAPQKKPSETISTPLKQLRASRRRKSSLTVLVREKSYSEQLEEEEMSDLKKQKQDEGKISSPKKKRNGKAQCSLKGSLREAEIVTVSSPSLLNDAPTVPHEPLPSHCFLSRLSSFLVVLGCSIFIATK